MADTIAEGVGTTVSETVRETVLAVGALASTEGVMVRGVAEKLRLDKSNASRRLRMAADGGYVRNLEDKRGKPGRWVIGDPLPESVDLLPDPAQLATADNTPDLGGCAVAPESDRENDTDEPDEPVLCQCGYPPPPGRAMHFDCERVAGNGHRATDYSEPDSPLSEDDLFTESDLV